MDELLGSGPREGASSLLAVSDGPVAERVRAVLATSEGLDRARRVKALLDEYIESGEYELVLYWPTDWAVSWRQNRLEADGLLWQFGWFAWGLIHQFTRGGRREEVWQYLSGDRTGLTRQSAYSIAWVANRWAPDEVHWGVPFSFHAAVTRTDIPRAVQHDLLNEAEEFGWKRHELRRAVKDRFPGRRPRVTQGSVILNGYEVVEGDPLLLRDVLADLLRDAVFDKAQGVGARIVTWLLSGEDEARQFVRVLNETLGMVDDDLGLTPDPDLG